MQKPMYYMKQISNGICDNEKLNIYLKFNVWKAKWSNWEKILKQESKNE